MKDKVLFAKTSITKFMALLVTLLTMFASCNFLGGEDVRTPTAGSNDPGKFNGMFKSVITGLGIQIWPDGKSFRIDSKGNLIVKTALSGAYGSYDENGADTTGKYDVSNVAYVKFDLRADSEGEVGIEVYGDSGNKGSFTFEREGDSEEDMMLLKDCRIDIKNKKEYSEMLFALSGNMPAGSKVRIENFAFYDESGKEVVPKYIKYAEGEKPENPDNPGEGEALPPFKSLATATVQPWVRDWGDQSPLFTPIYESGEFIVQPANDYNGANGGGYFAGVFGAFDNGVAIGAKFDVSKVAYATYEVKANEPVAGFMITLTNPNPAENKKDEIEREAKIDLTTEWQTKRINNYYDSNAVEIVARLFCSGDVEPKATTDTRIYIRNFTFYDRTGKEVVPKYYADGNVEGGGETKPPVDIGGGDTPDVPDDGSTTVTLNGVKYIYGGENGTWFGQQGAWDPTEQQPTVEQTSDGVKVTVIEKNGTEQWKGQIKLKSETEVVSGKKYDITVVVRSTQDFNGNVTYKPQLMSRTNENDAFAFEERSSQTVPANQDVTVEFKGKSVGKDGTFQMTFDFPGCDAGTEILIKSLTFKESADESDGGGDIGSDNNFIKLTADIAEGGKGGVLVFGDQNKMVAGTQYKLYVNDSDAVVRVFSTEIGDRNMEIQLKPDFKTDILGWSYCRKLGEIFPNGAGDYTLKIVPYVDGKPGEATEMKYTLEEKHAGWMPKIEGVKLTPESFRGSLSGITFEYAGNSDVDHFNVFTLKSDVFRDGISGGADTWGGNNSNLTVKKGGNILADVSNLTDFFKGGAGEYDVYFEPVASNGDIGTNVKVVKFTVEEDWLKESRVFTVTQSGNDDDADWTLTFNYKDVNGAIYYDVFVDLVADGNVDIEPNTFVKRMDGRKDIEIKGDIGSLRWQYAKSCRKLGEVFKKGAGDYVIKVLPVINGERSTDNAQYAKYTLSEARSDWWPKIDDFVDIKSEEENGKLTKITIVNKEGTQADGAVLSYNALIIKSEVEDLYDCWDNGTSNGYKDIWGKINDINIDSGISAAVSDMFKSGAGKYYILLEPKKAGGTTIGKSVAIREIEVPESWLTD